MMNNAKKGCISPSQFTFVLFTVRLFSLLINLKSLTDLTVYFVVSYMLSIFVMLFKEYFNNKTAKILLGIISILLMVQTVLSYVIFTVDAVHPSFGSLLLAALISVSVIYASSLKIEALSRFAPFCGIVLILALLAAVITNISSFNLSYIEALSFSPAADCGKIIKCLDLPVIYLLISDKVNGETNKPLKNAILYSYSASFLVLIIIYCVMGSAVRYYSYPAFTLFQLSRFGSFSRHDIAFTGSMLLALFLKCSVLLYCGLKEILGDRFEKN